MLNIRVDADGPIKVARLEGEFSSSESEGVVEQLHEHVGGAGARVAIDLSGVTLIDSTGLSILMNLVSRSRLAQGQVVIAAPSPFVKSVFSVTRLDTWFEVCPTLDDARRKLAAG